MGEVINCLLTGFLQRVTLAVTSSQELHLLEQGMNPLRPQELETALSLLMIVFQRDGYQAQEEEITRL